MKKEYIRLFKQDRKTIRINDRKSKQNDRENNNSISPDPIPFMNLFRTINVMGIIKLIEISNNDGLTSIYKSMANI